MRDITEGFEANKKLEEFSRKATNCILMIDGTTLDCILGQAKLEERFFAEATKSPSVCVCRCSPTQKAIITKKIAAFTGKRTAAIGDGGNDVGMILEANTRGIWKAFNWESILAPCRAPPVLDDGDDI